jgi:hypothetical protein
VVVLLCPGDKFTRIKLPETGEEIPSLPLMTKRRLLGYIIPAFNLPIFGWNIYNLAAEVQGGLNPNSLAFLEELLVVFGTVFLTIIMSRYFPIYTCKYRLEPEELTINRFLKGRKALPYSDIDRAEVYIMVGDDISSDAKNYATDQAAVLRKSGFKFQDYTNAESTIMNLYVGKNIIMISPSKPRSLLKELKRRNKRFTARIVELTHRGKSVQDLGG